MAFLRDQAVRLLRTHWASPQALAQELYAIMNADVPFTIDGPVTINNPSALPGITVNNSGLGDQAFQYNRAPSPVNFPGFAQPPGLPGLPDVPGFPPLPQVPDPGGLPGVPPTGPVGVGFTAQVTIGSSGVPAVASGPAGAPLPPAVPAGGGGGGGGGGGAPAVYGLVAGGSGDTYTVDLYVPDPAGGPDDVPSGRTIDVKQLQIDPAAAVPAGTAVVCFLVGSAPDGSGVYRMQVPVWL